MMGDRFSCFFGLMRRLRVLKDAQATQTICFGIDDAKRLCVEADLPFALIGLFDTYGLSGQRGGDADELAAPFDFTVLAHLARQRVLGIIGLGNLVGHGARGRRVEPSRRLLAKRLVRTLLVIVVQERFEPPLLSPSVSARGPHRLEQGAMEAFVPSVLLRMVRIYALVCYSQFGAPHRERRQSRHACGREGRAIVRSDRVGQPMFVKSPLEQRLGLFFARIRSGPQADQIAAETIGDRQRLAARAIAEPDPALVIDRPKMMRSLRLPQRAKPGRRSPAQPTRPHQPRPPQYLASRRGRRPGDVRTDVGKLADDLARPPIGPPKSLLDDLIGQSLRRRMSRPQRRMRALDKPLGAKLPIAVQPFVARLPADRECLAKLRHRTIRRQSNPDKSQPLVHRAVLFKRHRPVLPARRKLSPIIPVHSVTYLSGLNNALL